MRTEAEIKRALELLTKIRQVPNDFDEETKLMLTGCTGALEWFLGDSDGPLAFTIQELEECSKAGRFAHLTN